tara:strand:+ start:731 stop:1498 length:768 start_codon:yes stop_codon:yes gene_type:complete
MESNLFELNYKQLLMRCLLNGKLEPNRTGVSAYKIFNQSLVIDLDLGFPIVTAKKINFNYGLHEFLWMYKGKTDIAYLNSKGINWWDSYAIEGELGKVYGYQMRNFGGKFDQVEYVIKEIRNNSRRAIITLWNPLDLEEQALPCCYTSFNFTREGTSLNMAMNFRSSDMFLGLPYDIIVGALLLHEVAKETNTKPSKLFINIIDAHIYENHKEQVIKYNNSPCYTLPNLVNDQSENKYKIQGYNSGKFIKAKLNN